MSGGIGQFRGQQGSFRVGALVTLRKPQRDCPVLLYPTRESVHTPWMLDRNDDDIEQHGVVALEGIGLVADRAIDQQNGVWVDVYRVLSTNGLYGWVRGDCMEVVGTPQDPFTIVQNRALWPPVFQL